ncbi:hypothetical protein ACOMHN_045029 [Nucella lapillus]
MDAPLWPCRPEVAKSAMALKSKYTVQHRSDLLMKEHIQNVRSSQEALKLAIGGVENAKSRSEVDRWTQTVSEVKEKVDHGVLILQVMKKLNTELTYARSDLNEALYKGKGDINAARKRVIWLEDKMGELCGRKRLKSRPVNRLNRDYDTGSGSDDDRPLDSGERFAMGKRERTHSLAQILGSDFGLTSTDTETNRSGGLPHDSSDSHGNRVPDYSSDDGGGKAMEGGVEQLQLSHHPRRSQHCYRSPAKISPRQEEEREKLPEHRHLYASMTTLTSGHEDIVEESSGEFSPLKEVSVPDASDQGTSEVSEEGSQQSPQSWPQEHHIAVLPTADESASEQTEEETSSKTEQETEPRDTPSVTQPPDHPQYEGGDTPKTPQSRGGEDLEEDEEEDEDESDEEEEEEEEEGENEGNQEEEEKGTFITEYGVMESRRKASSAKQHVTIESPRKEVQEQMEEAIEEEEDEGAAYWQSEHHRFEYSTFSDLFGDVDPLSYHKMGLAVPGSFLKRSETDFSELPWKTVLTAKDIKDIHRGVLDKLALKVHNREGKIYSAAMPSQYSTREALDKLAHKVHNMQGKIYNAAMLSVRRRPPPVYGPPEASFLQSLDRNTSDVRLNRPGMMGKSKSLPSLSTQDSVNVSQEALPVPRVERQTTNTSTPSRLIFYPKPIPPPQVLPITRMSLNKEFPRFASSFAEPDPDQRTPAVRIVDQRNLMEETKLILYHQKPKPETPGTSSMERRFRKMIERDTSQSQKTSAKKIRPQFKMAAALATMQSSISSWKQIKPRSRGNEYQGLRWERVKTIVHQNLNSERVEERIDAAKQLGLLRCGDTMVFYALKERLHRDMDQRVRYEATKALILIGCWEDEVLRVVLKYLVVGNTEMRSDLISTLIEGKNVMYVDKSIPTFLELVKVLSHLCRNPDPDDQIAFDSAVLLGRLCVRDASAQARLLQSLRDSPDTHIRAKVSGSISALVHITLDGLSVTIFSLC